MAGLRENKENEGEARNGLMRAFFKHKTTLPHLFSIHQMSQNVAELTGSLVERKICFSPIYDWVVRGSP